MIDSHQHFWIYDQVRHSWIPDEYAAIRRDFLPEDLAPVLLENQISGCIAVQAEQTLAETDFLLGLAANSPIVLGVVGWVDLRGNQLEKELEYYSSFPLLKGFRHILQGEHERDAFLRPDFTAGLALLEKYGFSYDILVHADQLQYIPALAAAFPGLAFVLDHLGKPDIASGEISSWKNHMQAIAAFDNVSCKVSGMITEADLKNWKPSDLHPYLDTVASLFGMNRLMYGSDWPVCLAAGSYAAVKNIVLTHFGTFSDAEQHAFFNGNVSAFYKL
ncbi:amidohydrolase [Pedobacter antarcticus 4BY]|uniref:Amidohydrolase n=2 Tax=Pedobacter antarcticus TaxID=34086 RepID=A0A081PHT9_9SPHI|nr:amidohydrolase family protein [Pedobacter antarcticus]KEQ30262.1 amidohydrolase [Pedobacter antarcticus 4BY]SFF36727.1 L-fuconolactonase [Pedobacter antarcticus]